MGMIIARMIPKTARGTPKSENVPKRDSTGTGEAATTRVLAARLLALPHQTRRRMNSLDVP